MSRIRGYHIERAMNVVELAAAFPSAQNLCFVPGEYMFQQKLLPQTESYALPSFKHPQQRRSPTQRGPVSVLLLSFIAEAAHDPPNAARKPQPSSSMAPLIVADQIERLCPRLRQPCRRLGS